MYELPREFQTDLEGSAHTRKKREKKEDLENSEHQIVATPTTQTTPRPDPPHARTAQPASHPHGKHAASQSTGPAAQPARRDKIYPAHPPMAPPSMKCRISKFPISVPFQEHKISPSGA